MLGKIGGDADLSSRGRMYGMTLARHFNEAAIPGLRVWTSEKKRTIQTAKGINAPIESLEELNELDAVSIFNACEVIHKKFQVLLFVH